MQSEFKPKNIRFPSTTSPGNHGNQLGVNHKYYHSNNSYLQKNLENIISENNIANLAQKTLNSMLIFQLYKQYNIYK